MVATLGYNKNLTEAQKEQKFGSFLLLDVCSLVDN